MSNPDNSERRITEEEMWELENQLLLEEEDASGDMALWEPDISYLDELENGDEGKGAANAGPPNDFFSDDQGDPTKEWLKHKVAYDLRSRYTKGEPLGFVGTDGSGAKTDWVTVISSSESPGADGARAGLNVLAKVSDLKQWHGVVEEGPFYSPEVLRPDSPLVINSLARGTYFPACVVKTGVRLLGEWNGVKFGPQYTRPKPGTPVFSLPDGELADVVRSGGDLVLGKAVGPSKFTVAVDTINPHILTRHMMNLGTPGAGKSNTNGHLISQLSNSGVITVVVDTEGEYTAMDQPAIDKEVVAALEMDGLTPSGIQDSVVLHLVGTESSNPNHPNLHEFAIHLEEIPPQTLVEIMGLESPQEERIWEAIDLAKKVARKLRIFPKDQHDERRLALLDESTSGYPGLTLSMLYDMVTAIVRKLEKEPIDRLMSPEFQDQASRESIAEEAKTFHNSPQKSSWLKLMGQLRMLMRTEVFDVPGINKIDWESLMVPGIVIDLDLADCSNRIVSNLVIAHVLRNIRLVQETRYNAARKQGGFLIPVELFIEEAHEFLGRAKAQRMEMVMGQMRELILRGRKRKIGICLTTQYPQHMPREMLDAMYSAIIHQIAGEETIRGLKHSVPTVTESQWRAVGSLAQGSALVAFPGQLKMPVIVDIPACPFRIITPLGN